MTFRIIVEIRISKFFLPWSAAKFSPRLQLPALSSGYKRDGLETFNAPCRFADVSSYNRKKHHILPPDAHRMSPVAAVPMCTRRHRFIGTGTIAVLSESNHSASLTAHSWPGPRFCRELEAAHTAETRNTTTRSRLHYRFHPAHGVVHQYTSGATTRRPGW